ncbi:MAG: hypothetical protein B6245_01420 [Desulfobacteraceae bacterium 4572_88]|nr:MAG: hypothetical protein B6245_01420 [Desulfobacteraceae bacterium 4572_88]
MSQLDNGQLRILVADDGKNSADQYGEILTSDPSFELVLCHQGDKAAEAVRTAAEEKHLFAVAFLDLRMSPESDVIQVAEHIRELDPFLEIVIISTCPGISAEEIVSRVPPADKLLCIGKPPAISEIRQLALTLGMKWQKERESRMIIQRLERRVREQSWELAEVRAALHTETGRREGAEMSLEEEREKFFSFMKYQPAMTYIKDDMGKYVYVNEAYEKHFSSDIRAEGHIGKTDEEIWPPWIAKDLISHDRTVMARGKALSTVESLSVGNRTRYHLVTKFPIMRNNRSFALGAIALDITDKMRDEGFCQRIALGDSSSDGQETVADAQPPGKVPTPPGWLDIRDALKRLGDSWELYADLLVSFCDDKKNFCRKFEELIAEGDFESALVKAHALKGSSATISAIAIRDAAKKLEEACMEKKTEHMPELLGLIGEWLTELICFQQKIKIPENQTSKPPVGPSDGSEIFELLKKFDESLEEFDPLESKEYFGKIRDCLVSVPLNAEAENLLAKLAYNTRHYNFEKAGKILGELVPMLEVRSGK